MKSRVIIFSLICFTYQLFSQNNPSFDAHEWGTFTTLCGCNGHQLSGLFIDEEKLPNETYSIAFTYVDKMIKKEDVNSKGFYEVSYVPSYSRLALNNVTVKMETPVIYFYSKEAFNVHVNVDFPNGSISQWYPHRSAGELHPKNYLGYPATSSSIDFALPYNGNIQWNAEVLEPFNPTPYTIDYEGVPEIWRAPRATQSNKIKVQRGSNNQFEKEKYLFYRGIGNFEPPLKVKYVKRNILELSNEYNEQIPYILVYERKTSGESYVWWSGRLNTGNKVSVWLTDPLNAQENLPQFVNALVASGLYHDEAEAMLNTWRKSYFEKPGMKVFWILPRSYTDEILPISILPVPNNLERVMVGRTEILTPEFEELLYDKFVVNGDSGEFIYDRYSLAYLERAEQLKLSGLLFEDDIETSFSQQSLLLYPNPAQNILYFNLRTRSSQDRLIQIINETGSIMFENVITGNSYFQEPIDISGFAKGIYIVLVGDDTEIISSKFIKQ